MGNSASIVALLSVVTLKSGTITVNRGKRTGKLRLFAKSQHFRGRILLRTGTNTQEGGYRKLDLEYIKKIILFQVFLFFFISLDFLEMMETILVPMP